MTLQDNDFKPLTFDAVLEIARTQNSNSITKLSLGCGCYTDASVLSRFVNLKTLLVSCNDISDISFLNELPYLEEFYASFNVIPISQITRLKPHLSLQHVTLKRNPCFSEQNYHEACAYAFPNLKTLDFVPFIAKNPRERTPEILKKVKKAKIPPVNLAVKEVPPPLVEKHKNRPVDENPREKNIKLKKSEIQNISIVQVKPLEIEGPNVVKTSDTSSPEKTRTGYHKFEKIQKLLKKSNVPNIVLKRNMTFSDAILQVKNAESSNICNAVLMLIPSLNDEDIKTLKQELQLH